MGVQKVAKGKRAAKLVGRVPPRADALRTLYQPSAPSARLVQLTSGRAKPEQYYIHENIK